MAEIRYTRNLFLRSICAIYLFAFASLYVQIPGLYGNNGILPARTQMDVKETEFAAKLQKKPTLLWFAPYLGLDTEYMMDVLALIGMLFSFTGFFSQKFCSKSTFTALWSLYYSLYQVGQTFMWFQWDILLLETGFLCILIAPLRHKTTRSGKKQQPGAPRDHVTFWLVRWLLFRLMFSSGIVKLTSGCPTWWGLSALSVHFESQCLPTPLAWYWHHLPQWVLKLAVVGTYFIEIMLPPFFFFPLRAVRITAFFFQTPKSEEEWEKVSDDFNKIWHFPHCIGAMDGKHIVIEAPTFSGSEFFNYKGTFSVVLFAVVDANYNFLYANVGCQGRISDGGVFKNTPFYKLLVEGKLNLPQKRVLLGRDKESPYVLVADDAFPLKPCIMKPYSGHQDKGSIERVFNYRISRARRIVENVFGILASVFRVFRKPMLLQPEKVEKVTLACICLHNYLRCVLSKNKYNPPNSFDVEHIDSGTLEDGAWRKDQQTLQSFFNLQQTARKSSVEAMEIRKEFAEYFMSEQGQVPWQLKFC